MICGLNKTCFVWPTEWAHLCVCMYIYVFFLILVNTRHFTEKKKKRSINTCPALSHDNLLELSRVCSPSLHSPSFPTFSARLTVHVNYLLSSCRYCGLTHDDHTQKFIRRTKNRDDQMKSLETSFSSETYCLNLCFS